jgi:hypothetical protein
MRARSEEEERDDDVRFTTSLVGLAVALFLAVLGLYLLDALADESNLEDCMLQGRMNCEAIDSPAFAQ